MERNSKGQFVVEHHGYWLGKKRPLFSSKWRENLSVAHKGQKGPTISEDGKRRISESRKGNKACLGKKLSLEHRRKIGDAQRGSKASNWRGGVTPFRTLIWSSLKYRAWRESVFKRDNYTCVFCGARTVKLNADHIKPFAFYPELRFEVTNGRTLCISCHRTTPTYGKRVLV